MERRLAAILAADVVGYSRLMEADEDRSAKTLRRLGRVHVLLGNHLVADAILNEAIEVDQDELSATENPQDRSIILWSIAKTLAEKGDKKLARAVAEEAIKVAQVEQTRHRIQRWLRRLD